MNKRHSNDDVKALAGADFVIRVSIAELAAKVADSRAHTKLLYSSLADYGLEKLGMKGTSLPHLATTGRRLRAFPGIRDALAAGQIGWSQAMLLCRHATPENEPELLDLSRGKTIRELARLLAAPSRSPAGRGDASPVEAVDLTVDPSPDPGEPLPEPWGTLKLKAPARLLLKYEFFPDFVRKLEGRPVSNGGALEVLAAEVLAMGLSGEITQQARWRTPEIQAWKHEEDEVGDEESSSRPDSASRHNPAAGAEARPTVSVSDYDDVQMSAAREPYLQLFDPEQIVQGLNPDDPHDLDRRLVALRNLMQQLHGLFGEALRMARDQELHRQLGFRSFDAYCSQELSISKSKAYMGSPRQWGRSVRAGLRARQPRAGRPRPPARRQAPLSTDAAPLAQVRPPPCRPRGPAGGNRDPVCPSPRGDPLTAAPFRA